MTIQEKIAAHKSAAKFQDRFGNVFRTAERRDYAEFQNALTEKYGHGSLRGKLTEAEDKRLQRLHAAKVNS